MSKKNKMHPIHDKKKDNNLFTVKGGYISVKMDNIHEHLEETKRGCGAIESKKIYNRKKEQSYKSWLRLFFFFTINKCFNFKT